MMKPVLFNTEMVRAILDGRKTVTRRLIKLPDGMSGRPVGKIGDKENPLGLLYPCGIKRPPYQPGDILYVRETWAEVARIAPKANQLYADVLYAYRANGENELVEKWRPSIHMPKEAARLFLRVTDVRMERLRDITEEGALAEGIEQHDIMTINAGVLHEYYIPGTHDVCISARGAFSHLWDSTIKPSDLDKYGWVANPWVWAFEFERISMEDRTWI